MLNHNSNKNKNEYIYCPMLYIKINQQASIFICNKNNVPLQERFFKIHFFILSLNYVKFTMLYGQLTET